VNETKTHTIEVGDYICVHDFVEFLDGNQPVADEKLVGVVTKAEWGDRYIYADFPGFPNVMLERRKECYLAEIDDLHTLMLEELPEPAPNNDFAQLQQMGQAQRDAIKVGRYAEFTPSQLAQFFEGAEGIRGRMAGMPEYAEYELWLDGIPGYLASLDADIIRDELAKAQDTTDTIAALRDRVAVLEAALRPFALAAEDDSVKQAGSDFVLHIRHITEAKFLPIYVNGKARDWMLLNASDLLNAADALKAGDS
jgi:hypothetical protein